MGKTNKGKAIKFLVNEKGCHICTSHFLDKNGYPKIFRFNKFYRMSRYIYEVYNKEIPADTLVLHSCDNPSCINPQHLFIGNYQDNMNDKMNKGRCNPPLGEKNGCSKLKECDIIDIRKASGSLGFQRRLSEYYKVSPAAICNIRKGRSWKHV